MSNQPGGPSDDGTGAPLPAAWFEALPVPGVPEDFAAQVVARAGTADARPALHGTRLALGLAIAAAALALWLARPPVESGEGVAVQRTTWSLGERVVAVGEVGARLRWQRGPGGMAVTQAAGNVFYRVDRQGSLNQAVEVATPAGVVHVTGTCFRVEVSSMNAIDRLDRKLLWAAGGGALAATLVVVTVYEGHVRFGNAGGSVALVAGERASARSTDQAPEIKEVAGPAPAQAEGTSAPARPPAIVPAVAPPGELERLRERVRELEQVVAARVPGRDYSPTGPEANYVDPGKDELLARAKTCGLAWDMPHINRDDELDAKAAARGGLSEDERQIVNEVRKGFNRRNMGELRKLYIEVTGDAKAAELLSAAALQQEIVAKSPDGEAPEVFKRLSHERAGLMPPPAGGAPASPLERMMRLLTGLGDRFEQELGGQLGAARAHEMRTKDKGWGSRSGSSYGCPGERSGPR